MGKRSDLISPEYVEANRALHENPDYGASGRAIAEAAVDLIKISHTLTVLDYGCGKGRFARELRAIAPEQAVSEYDPAIAGKDFAPSPAEMVVCSDVLEHVEPDRIEAVLGHIGELMTVCGLFSIHHGPAQKTLPDGRNAHLIQRGYGWWLKKLERHFSVKRAFQFKEGGILVRTTFVVGRR